MLRIIFGDTDKMNIEQNVIFNTDVYFNNTFDRELLTSEIAKDIISDLDQSDVLGPQSIFSRKLNTSIPVERLSHGTKTLLLLATDSTNIYNASTCGDNCAKWILKIAEKQDITINLLHIMDFDSDFDALILNDNTMIHNHHEYIEKAIKFA